MTTRFRKMLLCTSVFGVAIASFASAGCNGCKKEEPSRWDPAAKVAEAGRPSATPLDPNSKKPYPNVDDRPGAAPPAVAAGSTLNNFFPPESVDGKKRMFTAEKDGYVEAKVLDGTKQIALLGVNDFNGKPDDIAKFDKATEKLGDFPLLMPTKKQTSILVGKRYQVKVTSDTLTESERKAMLEKFNLKGLATFVPPTK